MKRSDFRPLVGLAKIRTRTLRGAGAAVLCLAIAVLSVLAHVPEVRADDTILELRNARIAQGTGIVQFSREDLKALRQAKITTSNDFIDGTAVFSGPLATDVIDRIGRAGSVSVRMLAKNDYSIEVTLDEIRKYEPILALEMDGVPLSPRNKGPIWLMYPVSDYPELSDPAYNGKLIWQLELIELQ